LFIFVNVFIFFFFFLQKKNTDEYVMKACSHDLKGLMAVYRCHLPHLYVPLSKIYKKQTNKQTNKHE